jgi:glycerol-3-phosphate dehydrogenase
MSKLDKDQVIADFTAAYQQAHGKKPNLEAANGWFSVDGGKNMRLAQLAEATADLAAASNKPTKAAAQTAIKKPGANTVAKKSSAEKPVSKKSAIQVNDNGNGLSAKELWRQKLQQGATNSRLPRGF